MGVVLGAAASIVAEMGDNCSAQLKNCNTCCQAVEASLQVAAHHVLTLAKLTACDSDTALTRFSLSSPSRMIQGRHGDEVPPYPRPTW